MLAKCEDVIKRIVLGIGLMMVRKRFNCKGNADLKKTRAWYRPEDDDDDETIVEAILKKKKKNPPITTMTQAEDNLIIKRSH